MLKLGGIDNRPPKADQAMGKFRVARNVYCTPDNRLIPRYSNGYQYLSYNHKCVHNITQYNNQILTFVTRDMGSSVYKYQLLEEDSIELVPRLVPRSSSLGISPFVTRTEDYPQQVQTLRNNNVQYYLCPFDGTLIKYDGVEMSYAGVHQPITYSSFVNNSGQKTVKVLQHRIDFDQNILWSEAVSFPVLDSATNIRVRLNGVGSNMLDGYSSGTNLGNTVTKQLIAPKIAGDVYFKETDVIYYNTLPATGSSIQVTYATINDNKWYYWNGASYTLIATMPVISTTIASLPSIGEYGRVYKVTIPAQPLKYMRWQVNQKLTDVYASTLFFPAVGDTARAYFAKDTQLTYFWTGSAYSLRLNGGEYVELVNGTTYSNIQYTNFNNKIAITSSDSNITSENAGAWIILMNGPAGNGNYVGFGFSNYETVAYQIESVENIQGVATIYLDNTTVKTFDPATGWKNVTTVKSDGLILTDPVGRNSQWYRGTRTFFTYWASTTPNGSFTRKGTNFSFPESIRYVDSDFIDVTTATITTSIRNGFVPGATLNEVFNVIRAPISANEIYEYGDTPLTSMTAFDGKLLAASDNVIWYSNAILPNRFEMFNTISSLVVGSLEYGPITTICGTNEFLFISRQRKNYYLTGNLTTSNIRIQNITETEAGAWGNSSAISIKDSVIFITAKGVYQTVEGGRTSFISDTCPKNFNTFDDNSVNEDVVFKISGFYANPLNGNTTDNSICVAYDEFRDLLVFMQKTAGNPCLVLSTKTKEFYEWNGMVQRVGESANCITFILSKYHLGGYTVADSTCRKYIENKTTALSYLPTYPVKLYTTWLTGGEPSLEKNLLQLKMFGRIDSDGTTQSIDVCHYKDWNLTTKVTNSSYFPNDTSLSLNNQIQYSHKKRLNSDKVLSASVGIEINNPAISFEIESLEVEFTPIQQGMKR
jgi:hypothetical protein